MIDSILQRQVEIQASIDQREERLQALYRDIRQFDAELARLSDERQQFELVETICASLEQLSALGAERVFWGAASEQVDATAVIAGARANVAGFQKKIVSIEDARKGRQKQANELLYEINYLNDELIELDEQLERAQFDFVVVREERPLPYRAMVMPWSKQGEDERRYRKTLALALLLSLIFGGLVPFYVPLEPDLDEPIEIPEHLVRLVQERQPVPPQPREERPREEKPEESKPEQRTPTQAERQQAREVAENTGVLAFKDTFSDLLSEDVTANLGASASLSNAGAEADPSSGNRNLVVAQARTSGGVDSAAVSRDVGGSAGQRMGSGVEFSRVESSIGTDGIASERPLSDGVGPTRTDQEIQIVFDRYKAALYRIYNRELRVDPTLRGKMVLRLTIEPDGSVSAVSVESTDLKSDSHSEQILARVRSFNFGPKDGVPRITILYPIDFLPAS